MVAAAEMQLDRCDFFSSSAYSSHRVSGSSMHQRQMVAGVKVSCFAGHSFRTVVITGLFIAHGPV